jgi:hypothetical protein
MHIGFSLPDAEDIKLKLTFAVRKCALGFVFGGDGGNGRGKVLCKRAVLYTTVVRS